MPTSASRGRDAHLLVDTSVAVALVVVDHEHHDAVTDAVRGRRIGLAGHAAFETFSVLTRLPPPARRDPTTVGRLLTTSFPSSRFLGSAEAERLLRRVSELGIAGGAVYDALVGAVAVEHKLRLATRDARAVDVYRTLEVDFELIG